MHPKEVNKPTVKKKKISVWILLLIIIHTFLISLTISLIFYMLDYFNIQINIDPNNPGTILEISLFIINYYCFFIGFPISIWAIYLLLRRMIYPN